MTPHSSAKRIVASWAWPRSATMCFSRRTATVSAARAHAGCGLAVGRNGVCVFEHSGGYFAPPLVHAASLTNWTHVAVVYRDGQPNLYLNGVLARTGIEEHATSCIRAQVRAAHPIAAHSATSRNSPARSAAAEIVRLMTSMRATHRRDGGVAAPIDAQCRRGDHCARRAGGRLRTQNSPMARREHLRYRTLRRWK